MNEMEWYKRQVHSNVMSNDSNARTNSASLQLSQLIKSGILSLSIHFISLHEINPFLNNIQTWGDQGKVMFGLFFAGAYDWFETALS